MMNKSNNIINNSACSRRIQKHLAQFDKNTRITALELGSGAVGLVGLSLACMLACWSTACDHDNDDSQQQPPPQQQQQQQQHRVILTDHEPSIVQHLQRNVKANVARLQQELVGMMGNLVVVVVVPQIQVATLDWNDLAARGSLHPLISMLENRIENSSTGATNDDDTGNVHGNAATAAEDENDATIPGGAREEQQQQQQEQHTICPNENGGGDDHDVDALQLVIGSELVYTTETARACANSVAFLLERYPRLLVVIIQVIHRDGWSNVFLPLLREHDASSNTTTTRNIVIHEECIPVDCDTMARGMIPAGGTLDRFDFGACYIYNSDAPAFL
jgi:hypothetical protein